jgi:L-lactate utilization protein LutB
MAQRDVFYFFHPTPVRRVCQISPSMYELYRELRLAYDSSMKTVDEWHNETLGKAACAALEKNGFEARYAEDGASALDMILACVKPGMKVAFGGSMSLQAIGAPAKVAEKGAVVLDHNAPGLSPEAKGEIRRQELLCDLFLSSSNAVTLEGDIVNVDGNGNRVAALAFGPKKTIVVVGINKIVPDLDAALDRIETHAAPMNNKRLGLPNPCTKAGVCMDCEAPSRICCIYQVLRRKPHAADFTVIVVGERLGY